MWVMESPVLGKLTVMCIANRPKRRQIKLFSRKSTSIRRVFNRATKAVSLRLNTNEGYFAEKRHTGKDQSSNKV